MGYVRELVNRFQNLRQKPQSESDDSSDEEQEVEETYTVVWRTNGDRQDMIDKLTKLYPFRRTNTTITRRLSTSVTDCVQHIIGSSENAKKTLEPGCEINFRLLRPDSDTTEKSGGTYSNSTIGYARMSYGLYYSSEQSRIEIIFDPCIERLYEELYSIIGILAIGHDSSCGFKNPMSDFAIALHRGSWHRAKILYSVGNLVTVRLIDSGVRCAVSNTCLVPIPIKYVTCLPPKSVLCVSKWRWSEDRDSLVFRGKIIQSNLEKWYGSPHFDEPRIQIEESPTKRPKSFADRSNDRVQPTTTSQRVVRPQKSLF